MKLTGSSYVYIVILAVMLIVIGISLSMEHFSSKLLPLALGGFVFAMAGIALWRNLTTGVKLRTAAKEGEAESSGRQQWRDYLSAGTWIVGFFVAIHLMGFIIAIALFVLSYTKAHGRSWLTAILLTIFTTGIIYFLFEQILGVDLYRGVFATLLGF